MVVGAALSSVLVGCRGVAADMPRCDSPVRMALVAQAVPTASYVPCLKALPTGWKVTAAKVNRGEARFSLLSDGAEGRAVEVGFTRSCDTVGASPALSPVEGARSYLRLGAISPRYAGERLDVFPGGCVSARFDLPRGPHIPLMEDLTSAVSLYRRQDLRLVLQNQYNLGLDS